MYNQQNNRNNNRNNWNRFNNDRRQQNYRPQQQRPQQPQQQSGVIIFDSNYINSIRQRVHRKLPEQTISILLLNKIKTKISEKELDVFSKKLDDFDQVGLEKEINSNLNKLSNSITNFEPIYQKVNSIYKNRAVLLKYIIKNLIGKAVTCELFSETYAKFYKKFYTEETKQIFEEMFEHLLTTLQNTSGENYDNFRDYMTDKNKYVSLFIFISNLYKIGIMTRSTVEQYIMFLQHKLEVVGESTTKDLLTKKVKESGISKMIIDIKKTIEKDELNAEVYCKFLTLMGKEFVNKKRMKIIKKCSEDTGFSRRLRFKFDDLTDFLAL